MRFIHRLILLVPVLILATACGQNTPPVLPTLEASPTAIPATTTPLTDQANNAPIQPTTDPNTKPGTVRIIHAAADTPVINVSAGFLTVATNLDFAQSTEPTPLDAGAYSIKITPSGSRPGDAPLFETPYTLKSGASDILVIAKKDGQFQLLSFPETVVPLNPGESAITFINTVSGTNLVSIQQNGVNLAEALAFGQNATTGILASGAATLNIETGTTTTYEIDLAEQRHYTLVLSGQADTVSVANFSAQAPGRTTVRAINASETVTSIDVYLDDTLFADTLGFGRPTPRQNMISGEHTINVYATGEDRATAEALVSQTISFEVGANIALLFLGSANRMVILPYNEDLSPTPPGLARIAFLNTLDSVSTLRVETSGGQLPNVPDTGFGQTPGDTLLDASSYNFYLTRAGAPEETRTVETVQGVQLEQGNYYLYLVTGRQDNQPVILGEDIGFDETLAGVSLDEISADSVTNPIELRFVNAIADQTSVDFQVNGQVTTSGIGYGQGSELIPIEQSETTIEAMVAGSGDFLQSSDNSLESGSRYTVVAYGPDRNNVRMMVVPDSELIFDGSSPHLRLINLSVNTDTELGLGFSAQDPTPESGTPSAPNEDIRRSIPGGVQRLIDDIPGSGRSSVILMPTGVYDIEIIDSNTDQLATTFGNIELESGAHYDVIVYEENESMRIRGFVVKYPTDSGL